MIETDGASFITRRPDRLPYGHDEIFSFSSSDQTDLPHFPTPSFEIIQGDARQACGTLPVVHCVVTSVPYFKKRVYGESQNELGQESDVVSYVTNLVSLFSSIRLHQSGSMWINIGDTRGKRGELLNIPAAFAEAMRQAGFLIADHVVWAKTVAFDDGTAIGNFMPEPCHGRINGNGHESFFRFVRTKKVGLAWTDTMAVQIPRAGFEPIPYLSGDLITVATALNGRNIPNVWATRTGQTHEKHYAVFPPSLVERPVAMTAPFLVNPDGSLPKRISERLEYDDGRQRIVGKNDPESSVERKGRNDTGRAYVPTLPNHLGWTEVSPLATPGIVLDPFSGTATTGEVALKLGRSYIGIDLYENYNQIGRDRCHKVLDLVEYDGLYDRLLYPQDAGLNGSESVARHPHLTSLFQENDDCPAHLR